MIVSNPPSAGNHAQIFNGDSSDSRKLSFLSAAVLEFIQAGSEIEWLDAVSPELREAFRSLRRVYKDVQAS